MTSYGRNINPSMTTLAYFIWSIAKITKTEHKFYPTFIPLSINIIYHMQGGHGGKQEPRLPKYLGVRKIMYMLYETHTHI